MAQNLSLTNEVWKLVEFCLVISDPVASLEGLSGYAVYPNTGWQVNVSFGLTLYENWCGKNCVTQEVL